jgi:hypothetical protein
MTMLLTFIVTVDGSTGAGAFFRGIPIRAAEHVIVNRT